MSGSNSKTAAAHLGTVGHTTAAPPRSYKHTLWARKPAALEQAATHVRPICLTTFHITGQAHLGEVSHAQLGLHNHQVAVQGLVGHGAQRVHHLLWWRWWGREAAVGLLWA